MPPLPAVAGMRLVKALERHGFTIARIRGSHHVMRHPDGRGCTVPVHGSRDVNRGTLGCILRDVGMTIEQPAP
jgi:predicted RNA binding protein YcfA (HicA-like mRNA interferase family)